MKETLKRFLVPIGIWGFLLKIWRFFRKKVGRKLHAIKITRKWSKAYRKYKWRMRNVSYGKENEDKTFYICRRIGNDGLFAYVSTILGLIKCAVDSGFIPVIDLMSNSNTYLAEKDVGKYNSWELFFRQPFGFKLSDIAKSKNIIFSTAIIDGSFSYPDRSIIKNQADLEMWRKLFHRYIIINEDIADETDVFYREHLQNRKALGVLCRGTDYVNRKPRNHPVQPALSDLINKVEEVFRERNCDIIYLATEDEDAYLAFKSKFQNNLITAQEKRYRTTGRTLINDFIKSSGDDTILNARQYLISIGLLSRCSCLVAGACNGTYGALMMSNGYEYEYIFDLGNYT